MAPPSSAAARRVPSSRTAHESARRSSPLLRVVPGRRGGARRNRILTVVAASMVVLSLLVVVLGQAMLANGQVRLTVAEQNLALAQGLHRQAELQVASLETPSRVISVALGSLHLVHPAGVTQLPYVALTKPIPTPTITAGTAHSHHSSGFGSMSVTTRHAAQRARAVAPRPASAQSRVTKLPPRPGQSHQRSRPAATTPPRRPQRPSPHPRRPRTRPVRSRSKSWASATFQRRIRVVRLLLVVCALAVVARLIDIQVVHAGAYQTAASHESTTTVSIPALRGGIYDRAGAALALSQPTDDVIADDFQVTHPLALRARRCRRCWGFRWPR